ncbi:MAG: type II toxin-antitoxin system ParD family antitoxin [Thermomicrobiales bacterium]|nr:type II toxin-antitoxin system ParD family antitoxin [Thermomicrobiales bacterium]
MSNRRLRVSPEARQDIRHALRYTRDVWGKDQYIEYARRLKEAIELLRQFPGLGRTSNPHLSDIRMLPVGEHLVFYRYDGDTIEIARVLHNRMDTRSRITSESEYGHHAPRHRPRCHTSGSHKSTRRRIMAVTLTPQIEEIIRKKIEAGQYSDASELVGEAVRQLDARDQKLERLRAALQSGIDQADRGELIPWTPDLMDRLEREAEEMVRLGTPIKPDVQP